MQHFSTANIRLIFSKQPLIAQVNSIFVRQKEFLDPTPLNSYISLTFATR